MNKILKDAIIDDFKIVTNEYLLLFIAAMVGSFFIPFTMLWIPILGIVYMLVVFSFLFIGMNKLLYLSVFDTTSQHFSGYFENIHVSLLSKSIVAAFGVAEVLLIPIGTVLLLISLDAIEWYEILDTYTTVCNTSSLTFWMLVAELFNLLLNCFFLGISFMFVNVCIARICGANIVDAFRELIQIVTYLICGGCVILMSVWWIMLDMRNSIEICFSSIIIKIVLSAIMLFVSKRQVMKAYEKM